MELYQSYVSAITRAPLTMYEQRVILRLVEYGQQRISGLPLSREHGILEHNFNLTEVTVSIRDLLSDGSNHYNQVREAIKSLERRQFERLDPNGNWTLSPWVLRATALKGTGEVKLIIDKDFFDTLYNFSRGFVHYDLERAMSLQHPASVRFLSLINTQRKPMIYRIDSLKKLFGVADKYSRTNDFIRKIVEPARLELQKGTGNCFKYEVIKEGRKITALKVTTIHRATEIEKQGSIGTIRKWLPRDFETILLHHANFTTRQIGYHRGMIEQLCKLPKGMQILLDIVQRAREKRLSNPKGYIINALRDEVRGERR